MYPDILNKIFSYLMPNDLLNCQLVSKSWYKSANNDKVWYDAVNNYLSVCDDWYTVLNLKPTKKSYLQMVNKPFKLSSKELLNEIVSTNINYCVIFISVCLTAPVLIFAFILDLFHYPIHFLYRNKKIIHNCQY